MPEADDEQTAYGLDRYSHDFALWAAARASQRGARGAATEVLARAFHVAGLRTALSDAMSRIWNAELIDRAHKGWCESFLAALPEGVEFTHGSAAKFIAIYLKVTVVIRGLAEGSSFVKHLHPPIDAVLLQRVPERTRREAGLRRTDKWTKFDCVRYQMAIATVRAAFNVTELWRAEEWWNPYADPEHA